MKIQEFQEQICKKYHAFRENAQIVAGLLGAGIGGFIGYQHAKKKEESKYPWVVTGVVTGASITGVLAQKPSKNFADYMIADFEISERKKIYPVIIQKIRQGQEEIIESKISSELDSLNLAEVYFIHYLINHNNQIPFDCKSISEKAEILVFSKALIDRTPYLFNLIKQGNEE